MALEHKVSNPLILVRGVPMDTNDGASDPPAPDEERLLDEEAREVEEGRRLACFALFFDKDAPRAAADDEDDEEPPLRQRLEDAGLDVVDIEGGVLVSARVSRLLREAVRTSYPLELDAAKLRAADVALNRRLTANGLTKFGPRSAESSIGDLPDAWFEIPAGVHYLRGGSSERRAARLPYCERRWWQVWSHDEEPNMWDLDPYMFHFAPLRFVPTEGAASEGLGIRASIYASLPLPLDQPQFAKVMWDKRALFRTELFRKHVDEFGRPQLLPRVAARRLLRSILVSPRVEAVGSRMEGCSVRLQDKQEVRRWLVVQDPAVVERLLKETWRPLCLTCGADCSSPERLRTCTLRFLACSQFRPPLNAVRNEFGDRAAFYFAFISFYSLCLVSLAAVGTAAFAHQLVLRNPAKVKWLLLLGLVGSVWCTLLTKLWRRRAAFLRLQWGIPDQEEAASLEDDTDRRPEYDLDERVVFKARSIVSGKWEMHENGGEKRRRAVGASTGMALGVVAVLAFVIGMAMADLRMRADGDPAVSFWAAILVAALTRGVLMVADAFWQTAAEKLTSWEHHRTHTAHSVSLRAKIAAFRLVSNFALLFFVAFLKPHIADDLAGSESRVGSCAAAPDGKTNSCLYEAALSIGSGFIVLIVVSNFIEIVYPRIIEWWRREGKDKLARTTSRRAVQKEVEMGAMGPASSSSAADAAAAAAGTTGPQPMRTVEGARASPSKSESAAREAERLWVQSALAAVNYDELNVDEELDEVALQMGYNVLFLIAFPIAPVLSLVNNVIEVSIDADKLGQVSIPFPAQADGVGAILHVFDVLGFVATLVNAALVSYDPEIWLFDIETEDLERQTFLFFALSIFALVIQIVLFFYLHDVPKSVLVQRERGRYLVAKHIEGRLALDEAEAEERSRRRATRGVSTAAIPRKLVQSLMSGKSQRSLQRPSLSAVTES
jgi:hypothetical protein